MTASWRAEMRVMFIVYLALIAAGLVLSTAVGLMQL
jgi:hypothetical protein